MKNLKLVLFIGIILSIFTSCKENINGEITDKDIVWDEKHPPPPPSQELLTEIQSSTPPPSAVVEAIRSTMLQQGATVLEISKQINDYKNQLKKDCPPCYAELKDK